MNEEKQIEEMAFNLIMATSPLGVKDLTKQFDYKTVATDLYELYSWRKASEIFEEMREELVRYLMLNENIAIKCKEENGEWNAEYWKGKLSAFKQIRAYIDTELKKKYTK